MDKLKFFLKEYCIYIICLVGLLYILIRGNEINQQIEDNVTQIEKIDVEQGKYEAIYKDQTIESLKKENRELYDSIKQLKTNIDYLVQFTAKKEYKTDTIFVPKEEPLDSVYAQLPDENYTYSDVVNDAFKYDLTINSKLPINWYKLNVETTEQYTLLNSKLDDNNKLTIKGSNGTEINGVTILNTKKKKKLKDIIAIGPSVNVGYDMFNKRMTMTVGGSITIDLY